MANGQRQYGDQLNARARVFPLRLLQLAVAAAITSKKGWLRHAEGAMLYLFVYILISAIIVIYNCAELIGIVYILYYVLTSLALYC